MRRCYVSPEVAQPLAKESQFILDPQESHHLVRVLRVPQGGKVIAFDGTGLKLVCEVLIADPRRARLLVLSIEQLKQPDHQIVLAQGLPKSKAFEEEVRRATELGVSEIIPLVTEFSQTRIESVEKKYDRWQQAAIEACKQSGNLFLPKIHPVAPFLEWLNGSDRNDSVPFVASLEPIARRMDEVLPETWSKSLVAIGPEGDFSHVEYGQLYAAKFYPISLSTHVLRVETAAIYMLSILDNAYKARHPKPGVAGDDDLLGA